MRKVLRKGVLGFVNRSFVAIFAEAKLVKHVPRKDAEATDEKLIPAEAREQPCWPATRMRKGPVHGSLNTAQSSSGGVKTNAHLGNDAHV